MAKSYTPSQRALILEDAAKDGFAARGLHQPLPCPLLLAWFRQVREFTDVRVALSVPKMLALPMVVSLCVTATYQWQYSVIGELDGDVLSMRGAVFPAGGGQPFAGREWMLDTTGAVQLDDVTWFPGGWNAAVFRADSCVLSTENAGSLGFAVRQVNGEIWATTGVPFTANGDVLQRRAPDGSWATVLSIPEAFSFWVNSERDIWVPHGQAMTHFDGQVSTTEFLPAPSGSEGHRNDGIWVSPGGEVWVAFSFFDPARDHLVSQVLRRTPNGWEIVLSVDEDGLRVFGGVGETVWVTGGGAVRRWDGSTLIPEDTGSTAQVVDGIGRDDGSTVMVGAKGAVLVRSPTGQWRTLPVKTSVTFTSVTRGTKGRLVLGTGGATAACHKADDVCPSMPPTTDAPAAAPPTLAPNCRLPGVTSPGCGCGSGASVSAAWLVIALARLKRRSRVRGLPTRPGATYWRS